MAGDEEVPQHDIGDKQVGDDGEQHTNVGLGGEGEAAKDVVEAEFVATTVRSRMSSNHTQRWWGWQNSRARRWMVVSAFPCPPHQGG